ncbi:MAG: molybdopterin oxidoreductase [Myxococcales bacterium]
MGTTRRDFIKLSATGAGALALGSGLLTDWWGLPAHAHADPGTDGDRVVPTFCELCFWKCGVLAHVKDGKVTKITGNPKHPLSKGRLCPRGVGGTGLLYDPDRLKTPLIRTRQRGEDTFEAVSWDRALDHVAENLLRVKEKHGPEALALFSHGFGGSWFNVLMKAYGSPNIGQPSYAQCRGPREAAFSLTYGTGLGSPEPLDIANTRCLTLIGSHLGENMHNTQVQELADAVGAGAELVVVDPRFSVAAGKARYWLPIKPGTDTALLLAWMHVIIGERRYDADFVTAYTSGFEALREHVADKTPEWAYPLTGIEPGLIRETARFISSHRPASLVHPGRHATWYGDDTQRMRAVAILAALLGSWGRRGGYITQSAMPLPPYPFPMPKHEMRGVADRPKEGGWPFAEETLANGLRLATFPGKGAYDIKAWLVYGTNLIQSLPRPAETIEAIQHLDFLVTVDVLPAEIVGWSDVVLPEATYLEREDDLWAPAYKEPFVAVRQRAVEPLHESKPGWWIAKELGRRMGLGATFDFEDALAVVRARAGAGGYDVDELLTTGVVLGKAAPTCEEEGAPIPIFTDSGKVELRSEALEKAGFDALPAFYPQEEPPPGMFRLITGRAAQHTFGRTANNRLLAQTYGENDVWVNAAAARAIPGPGRPLRTGDRVVLVNQDGVRSLPVKVRVTERIRGDAVYMVHGWGHTAKGLGYAAGKGASDSELTTRYAVDPIMGGTGTAVNFVRIEAEAVA